MLATASLKLRPGLCLLLIICLIISNLILPAQANDRSAEIIGSRPLLVKRLISPAGLSGQGQIIGLADSGLDIGNLSEIHPDLQSEPGSYPRVVMLQSYSGREIADDPSGHGTFMAATMVGSGKASQGLYQGIAPGASIYFQALLDQNGDLKIPAQTKDIFRPAYDAGVRIHVNGWGNGSNAYSAAAAEIDRFVYYYPDFLPVFAAGNAGPDTSTLTSQANSKNALVVGSSQVPRPALDPESRFADQVAASSSVGPAGDGRIKPDLLAPGSAVISACSSLIESNFAANPAYTRMGGTSMAAAVTGGALALLREQLTSRLYIPNPSAALMRAAVINGARSLGVNIKGQGFGILDLAGTCLALRERTFKVRDEKSRLLEGQIRTYQFQVDDPSPPVKITLAWTDPEGDPGADSALVNNLDLVVVDPNGKTYLGNDSENRGKTDSANNVEQVTIPDPKTGEYTIRVKASSISSGSGQDFALVYGQSLKTGIVRQMADNTLQLIDGSQVDLDDYTLHQVVEGVLDNEAAAIRSGSEVYFNGDALYVFGQVWHTGGIQALPTEEGDLFLEMNSTVRQGGYYRDYRAGLIPASITVNQQTVSSTADIAPGSELMATVNPALQTLWQLEAVNEEIEGVVEVVLPDTGEIKLRGIPQLFKLAAWAAINYQDGILDVSAQNAPYGTSQNSYIGNIVPGTQVALQVSPQSRIIQSIRLQRPMVAGRVTHVDTQSGFITLDTGRAYYIYSGTVLNRDKSPVSAGDITAGDFVLAQLGRDKRMIIGLEAFSQVHYGRVVFASLKERNLYLIDSDNRSRYFRFERQAEIFSGGIQLESNALASGSWVRVITDPHSNAVWRADIAEVAEEKTKTIAAIDTTAKMLRTTDGSSYNYSDFTRISKGGFSIEAADLMPGDRALITTLEASAALAPQLAGVEARIRAEAPKPNLRLTASSVNGVLVVQGFTTGDRLYLYRQDGSHQRLIVDNGVITGLYSLLENETALRALALDSATGGINSLDVQIEVLGAEPEVSSFLDIAGHWAENAINDLAQRGILKGYGDGNFGPDRYLSRAELSAIVARWGQMAPATIEPGMIMDYKDIPWWALQDVLAVRQAGLMISVSGGSFLPNRIVTRQEIEMVVARLKNQASVDLFPGTQAEPNILVTRAQAAAIFAGL